MRLAKSLSLGLVAGLAILAQTAPAAAQTGSFKGTFVLKNEAPKLDPIKGDKDPQVCAVAPIPNEILILDPATKGVKNVFVWAAKVGGKDIPKADPAAPKLTLDNKGCVFVPHCAVANSAQTLVMLNDDSVGHNVHTSPIKPPAINDLIAPNTREAGAIERPVGKAQILPIPVKCDIHPWMTAHLLILDHNFATLSNEKGEFTIEGLPPGTYDFKVWHEAGGYVIGAKGIEKVKITAGQATDGGKIELDTAKMKNLPK